MTKPISASFAMSVMKPVIGFVSHFDTTPDFTGANVKPQIVSNYEGMILY
jgi:di/tripeptidase